MPKVHAHKARTRLNTPLPLLFLLAALASSCDGPNEPLIIDVGVGSTPQGPLAIVPPSFTLEEGESITLKAQLSSMPIGQSQVGWQVSPASVASVNQAGVVVAQEAGEVTVTGTYASLSASAQGTVQAVPRQVTPVTEAALVGTVGMPLEDSVRVRVVSGSGAPVPGVRVEFQVVSGEGSVSDTVRYTDADGEAKTEWTLGLAAGQQELKAAFSDVMETETYFMAQAWPDYSAPMVVSIHGDDQEGEVATILPDPLRVLVADTFGNPLPDMVVEWSFGEGGGSLTSNGDLSTAEPVIRSGTDEEGFAEMYWVLGPEAGSQAAISVAIIPERAAGQGGGGGDQAPGGSGGSKAKFNARAKPGKPYTVEITPPEVWVDVGGATQLEAAALDRWGNVSEGAEFQWSADGTGVATVDQSGNVQTQKPGRALISAKSGKASGGAYVYASTTGPAVAEIQGGDGQQGQVGSQLPEELQVKVRDENGYPVAGAGVTFSIVDGGGSVESASTSTGETGVAETRWTLGEMAGEQRVHAVVAGLPPVEFSGIGTPGPVASLTVTPSILDISVGMTAQLRAAPKDAFGNAVFGQAVAWSSLNSSIATVDATGLAMGVAEGTTEVTASVQVDGADAAPSGFASSGPAATGGQTVEGASQVQVVGDPGTVTSILLSPSSTNLAVGEALTLTAQAYDQAGNPMATPELIWVSTNSSVASVSGDGRVTALAEGGTQIQATGGGVTGFSQISVQPPASVVTSIQVSPTSASVDVGETKGFTATAKDQFGEVMSGVTYSWSSSANSIASVASDGRALGIAVGTASIRARAAGVTGSSQLTVTEPNGTPVFPGTVADLSVGVVSDGSVTLRWTQVDDGNGSPASYAIRYGSPTVQWGGAYASEVSVAGTSIGAVMEFERVGLSPGTDYQFQLVAFRGALNNGAVFGGLSNKTSARTETSELNVIATPSQVAFSTLGETIELSARVEDSSGNTVPGISLEWTSLNSQIASVDQMGKVTARAAGSALIVVAATCCGGAADTVNVSVIQIPQTVTVSPDSTTVAVGGSYTLSAAVFDANGVVIPAYPIDWSSGNSSIASVNQSGRISGVSPGLTEIRAQAGDAVGLMDLVVIDPIDPPPPFSGEPFFEDGFESGDLSKQGGSQGRNFRWNPVKVDNSGLLARSGSRSARVRFLAADDPNNSDRPDAWSVLFFSMDPISPAKIWVEYYVYFPSGSESPSLGAAFCHRRQSSGGDEHKYFRVYANPYINGPAVGFDADNALDNCANELAPVYTDKNDVLWGGWKLGNHFVGVGGTNGTPQGQIPRGGWVQFRFQFEEGSGPDSNDGVIKMWVDGSLVWSNESVPLWAGNGKHYFDTGYIFNYANAGFAEETWVFVDDVKFWDSDPGW